MGQLIDKLLMFFFIFSLSLDGYSQISDSIFANLVSLKINLSPIQIEKCIIETQSSDNTIFGDLVTEKVENVNLDLVNKHITTIIPISVALDTMSMTLSSVPITASEKSYTYFIIDFDGFRCNIYKYEFGEDFNDLKDIQKLRPTISIHNNKSLHYYEDKGNCIYSIRLFPPNSVGHCEYNELSIFCIPHNKRLYFYDKAYIYPTFEDLLIANFGSVSEYITILYKSIYSKKVL